MKTHKLVLWADNFGDWFEVKTGSHEACMQGVKELIVPSTVRWRIVKLK